MRQVESRVFKIEEGNLCTILLAPTGRSDFCVGACDPRLLGSFWFLLGCLEFRGEEFPE